MVVMLPVPNRPEICGLCLDRPRIMGILNVTPDSFSDGGEHEDVPRALSAAWQMIKDGADILDIGGESTRPGALPTPGDIEMQRVIPVIKALVAGGCPVPISIDTRKAAVARAALGAGARLFNDVTALTYEPESLQVALEYVRSGGAVCLMHSAVASDVPLDYQDVTVEVMAYLQKRIEEVCAAGLPRQSLLIDPGIGFSKTFADNLQVLSNLHRFHELGVPVLLGASRKSFIGAITGEAVPAQRLTGSVAVALAAVAQGVHVLRVHDVAETAKALRVWSAVMAGGWDGKTNIS